MKHQVTIIIINLCSSPTQVQDNIVHYEYLQRSCLNVSLQEALMIFLATYTSPVFNHDT